MAIEKTAIKEREESYSKKIKPETEGYPGILKHLQKDGCLMPSVKVHLIRKLKNDIESNLTEIDKIKAEMGNKTPTEKQQRDINNAEASVLKRLHTLAEIVIPVAECKGKQIPDVVELVTKDYPKAANVKGYNELLDTIRKEYRARKEFDMSAGQQRGFEQEVKTLVKQGVPEPEAKEHILDTIPNISVDKFTSDLYRELWGELRGIAYDGANINSDQSIRSPCGLKGTVYSKETANREGIDEATLLKRSIFDAIDTMSGFGSKEDWKAFYDEGKDAVEGDRFHRLNAKDWPGCWADLYNGRRFMTEDHLNAIAKRRGLKPDAFVSIRVHPEGYKAKD